MHNIFKKIKLSFWNVKSISITNTNNINIFYLYFIYILFKYLQFLYFIKVDNYCSKILLKLLF